MRRGLNLYGCELVVEMSLLTRSKISYEDDIYMMSGAYLMSPHFSETLTIIVMEFTFKVGTFLQGCDYFSTKSYFIINIPFRPLRETLYTGPVKLFPAAPEIFSHAEFQLVVVRNTVS